jgi:hypothetical protein
MLGWLVEVRKTKENGDNIVAKWKETSYHGYFYSELIKLEEQGKALCIHDGGGYPDIYSAKTTNVMPLVEKGLNARPGVDKNGFFMMLGYSVVSDIPVVTTKDISDIPFCSPDETLIIELWDLS